MVDEFERTLRLRADNYFDESKHERFSMKGFIFWNLALEYERLLGDYRDWKKK